ncbi:MAG: prepilin-type N-terminal cleavage/methylation domain-containing protein [Candidatus Paceibacterota bacterium]|jgi:prepilin-type N-terminal cleavage/methylation domain-containing protein
MKNKKKLNLKKTAGFTLLETVVVISIFTIAISAIFSVEFYGHKLFLQQQDLAEVTQNGRVIMERFTREIRQAKKIVNVITEQESTAPSQIEFQDGHISSIYATSTPQSISTTTITLAAESSSVNDFYKDSFIEIISGWGNANNKTRKITEYDGSTKIATIDQPWQTAFPTVGSVYKIDSGYYYIRYFASSTEVYREVKAYYFPSDPNSYLPHNATSTSETLTAKNLEEPRIIGEFAQSLKFWGNRVINIKINLVKNGQSLEIANKILGRNL